MPNYCHYVIVDAFPSVDGPHFDRFAGAVVGCWIAPWSLRDNSEVKDPIGRHLEAECWIVGRILERQVVSSQTYRSKIEGKLEFEAAMRDGFAAHVHTRAREVIRVSETAPIDVTSRAAFNDFVERIQRNGGYSIQSDADVQWANGTSPDGDDFMPLWTTSGEAEGWLDYWPGYEVKRVALDELCEDDGILDVLSRNNMWVAIGRTDAITTVHPLLLRNALVVMRR